jgi:hypothetical protein
MEMVEFMAMVEKHLTKLANGSLKLKGLKALAYELAEKEHIGMTGQRKFAHYTSFSNARTKKFGKAKEVDIDDDVFIPTARKRTPIYKKGEFDSKFNWLF